MTRTSDCRTLCVTFTYCCLEAQAQPSPASETSSDGSISHLLAIKWATRWYGFPVFPRLACQRPRFSLKCLRVTQVFLREAERQRLQTLLHQEVLRRIVTLQRRFRAVLERKHFLNMKRASCVIQVRHCSANWKCIYP